ncbi:HNH endonuclease [Pseudomonas mandelii]|uniref:HNH endonuclease n=1 Tax=Pseudomonas mandelii TaxID=75612 RepID=UPI001C83B1E1|nr:HNH endonuclease signature motif containing protein [Pseudomonas mandelii]QZA96245.1 HNH endonuclease [Pseudomonas mandelii]
MRILLKPVFTIAEVYDKCLAGVGDAGLVASLQVISPAVSAQAELYDSKAIMSCLYQLPQNTARNEDVILDGITKKQLKSLYSQYMVPQDKPARIYYDLLIGMAPHGKCPYCGFGQASTLDHYLPKSKYPFFAILAANLVPSCKDCNTGKSADIAGVANEQSIHPYYDSAIFVENQWLFAKVEESHPPSITYFVSPPSTWLEESKQRALKHFEDFKLAKRFSIEAADEISSIADSFSESIEYLDDQEVRRQLLRRSNAEFQKHKNSWKTALYQALASSDWYCAEGCRI